MKRRALKYPVLGLLLVLLTACNLTSQGGDQPTSIPGAPTANTTTGTIVAATSSIPTSMPQSTTGNKLPPGALILTQVGKPIAQLPNRQTISLPNDRFGAQGSPDGRFGVRFDRTGTTTKLVLVDYAADPNGQAKDVPQGQALNGPGVTWKEDASGFAFFDFPPANNPKAANTPIWYYDAGSGQTKELVPAPKEAGTVATTISFSPDGKYLLYAVGSANAEGMGGPGSKLFLFDTGNNQASNVPAEAAGFSQWLKDSKGFISTRTDQSGVSQVTVYNLPDLTKPKVVTPTKTSDFLVDLSPDGKRMVITSTPAGQNTQVANIWMMNVDGSSRKQMTQFNTVDQTITALIWGNDGIYYSLSGADNKESTWRMDLDGKNATQVAQGTLNAIIGAH
jgi:sugar lactone lactonase YvrE